MRLATALHAQGSFARALDVAERAETCLRGQHDPVALSEALSVLGDLHLGLRRPAHAEKLLAEGLALLDDMKAPHAANLVRSLAYVRQHQGRDADARTLLMDAGDLCQETSDSLGLADILVSLGHLELRSGNAARARDLFVTAIDWGEGAPSTVAYASLGGAQATRALLQNPRRWNEESGDLLDQASRWLTRRVQIARWLALSGKNARISGDLSLLARTEGTLAREALYADDPLGARTHVLAALQSLQEMGAGLSSFADVEFRDGWRHVHDIAVYTALHLPEPEQTYEMLERTRALALVRTLVEQGAVVPKRDEPDALRHARERVVGAQRALAEAVHAGLRAPARRAEETLQEARAEYALALEAVGRTGNETWHAVNPATLADLRAALAETDAFALTAASSGRLKALVITRDTEPVLRDLGPEEDVADAVGELRRALIEEGSEIGEALATIRHRAIDGLHLGDGITRLLLSPHGALAETPFSVVDPSLAVVFVPSATTYVLGTEREFDRGERVLALGDPDYGWGGSLAYTRGRALGALPQTRLEVEAVTTGKDVCLLGSDATEAGFLHALGAETRWRSVHLACHGLVDEESPAWSSLALTPTTEDDGFLTVIEVLTLRVPSDLAVLSACETGLGRRMAGEGMMGLTSAFLHAGIPRVLASLWKVDDEATRALMVKFYEAWSGDGGPGAAKALREAQAHVRSHEKWKHPYYWAAWVLWGTPD